MARSVPLARTCEPLHFRRRGSKHQGGGTPRRGGDMDEEHPEELLRRALIDRDASAGVALRVGGLPVCEQLTVVFHGRRALGTIQTYVTHGGQGAGTSVSADALLRVPCDLDLGDAEDREAAEQLYAEQAAAMRDALVGADVALDLWREPLQEL